MKNWAKPWRISFPSSMKISTSFWRNFLQSLNLTKDTFLEFLRHGSTEHHNLLVVGCFDKNLLNVSSHVWVSENFVAFVNDKEFALS